MNDFPVDYSSAKHGRLLAFLVAVATAVLIVIGTIWPNKSALALADSRPDLLQASASPRGAVDSLLQEISRHDWSRAYNSLANKAEFSQAEFEQDLTGSHGSLRTTATMAGFDVSPVHASGDEAHFRADLRWSSVVGTFHDRRNLDVIHLGEDWRVVWPIVKEPVVPPQVIPVNYLRWDVIYRGAQDDWGRQDVEAPHVRIVDMHPVNRESGGVVILGELLNEDVVPAFVAVKATLLAKNGSAVATEDAFDEMSHVLLPKQVTPFRIDFPNARFSQVDSVRMEPASSLISASADPVIAIEGQQLNASPDPALNGELVNQSGQVVNVAHVLATFYDRNGQIVWVSDQYANRALLPQTPVNFSVSFPVDLASKVANYRVIANAYSSDRLQ
ncbi:MAG TPA: hypothetical protein VMH85_09720 [Terriglobales bacterium]|nr:hypothetical protein [Terriglobales bacterium]